MCDPNRSENPPLWSRGNEQVLDPNVQGRSHGTEDKDGECAKNNMWKWQTHSKFHECEVFGMFRLNSLPTSSLNKEKRTSQRSDKGCYPAPTPNSNLFFFKISQIPA